MALICGVAYTEDDVHYALEQTRILHEPDRRIDTFGTTEFEFTLISELMDGANQIRIRSGRILAEKPMLFRPEPFNELSFEGFGDGAEAFHEWLKQKSFALLKYGFAFRKSNVVESLVHDDLKAVEDRVLAEIKHSGNPNMAIIRGVDDTWEICLLRFTVEMIQKSAGINMFDYKRRGLL